MRVGRHRRRVSEGMTGMRECPRDPTSMRRPRRAPCPPVVDETLPASPSGARYWVYLVMAVTILFNVLKAFSRFRLWRIDAAREKLETALKELVDPGLTHAQIRAVPAERVMAVPERRAAAEAIMERLVELRARCQRQTSSIVTPMGDEMFYRYQQSLIDEAATILGALLQRSSSPSSR